ncbi:hypothetical protein E3T61_10770 [Cryobacterium lactosi]|uniref:Glycosyltransferase RgtA/B/C/D-like domain-containing protein n=1 Tax=Cryobacterium lactosi TaxID=1259202 RepID=A0A4R9BS00_9MICO|nr:glycosyltransferase family 39 protein [Cryobacterium lactosi]TFD89399.1 hypothetical protein E3T61_10770 [Cryobacterium lactosi]
MTIVLASPLVEASGPTARDRRGFAGTAALLGLVGFLVSAAGSWQPSYWGDEAASVLSAERPIPSLFRMLGNVDAVHGIYYLLLHGWINLFGASEFATRLPSAVFIGAATAGTAVLARMLVNPRAAVIAALVFAMLPRVTYMGAETRSTALATLIGVWSSVLLVHVVRSRPATATRSVTLWAGYAVLLAAGIGVFIYAALLVPVHALVVLLLRRQRRRSTVLAWTAAAAVALILASPILVWSIAQRHQVSFLAHRVQAGVLDAAVQQWFGAPALAFLAWLLIAVGCLATFVPRFLNRPAGFPLERAPRAELLILLAWLIVPSTTLLIGTHLISPMYSFRYLSFCAPAAAILMAVGIVGLRPRWAQALTLLLVVVLAAPGYLAQRTEFAKDNGSDWRQTADILRTEARPRDAVVFDESTRPSRRPRLAMHLYPAAFVGLNDVTLDQPFQDGDGLWDSTIPLADATSRLAGTHRVWLLQNVGSSETTAGTDLDVLRQAGFSIATSRTINRTILIEMTR